MKYFRKLITNRKLAAIFAVGMLLRATIAVGYMLDTNPADGSFLSVIICEGPAGINAIEGLNDHSSHHSDHHSTHDNTDDNNEHDHASQDHPMSSCSFWSGSSLSLIADLSFFDISTFVLSEKVVYYQNQTLHRLSSNTHPARAPPALS
jgi:hypothetical protein